MKTLIKNFLLFVLIFLVIAGFFNILTGSAHKNTEINLNQFVSLVQEKKIKEIVVTDTKINLILNDGQKNYIFKESNETLGDLLKNYNLDIALLKDVGTKVQAPDNGFWFSLLPFLSGAILLLVFFFFLNKQLQKTGTQAMKFGESGVKEISPEDQKNKIRLDDVAGVKEAKSELKEVIDFLKKPQKFVQIGAKIPKGVLLIGAPGTGKTLLARAVAGEAGVPFFHISGSEFIELFVGVGASRVRDLFKKAKKSVPAILFIDELDAVGRLRGGGFGGSHDEREQTLNQILVELDGFEPNIGLVVMAATNRPDILDPALLRPGRFDRKIILDMPDVKDREKILEIHSRNKPLANDVKFEEIAQRTPGFSGADLENLVNEAAISSAILGHKTIAQKELLTSIEKVLLGPERKSFILSEKEKKVVAVHEAGHAIVIHFLPNSGPVRKISIIARGRAAGYTIQTPRENIHLYSKSELFDNLCSFLGGYAAEKLFFGEVTSGAAEDLKEVTKLAKKIVTKFGMDETLGPRSFGQEDEMTYLNKELGDERDYSEKTAESIDQAIAKIVDQAYHKTAKIVKENKEKIEKTITVLMQKETLEKEEFEKIMRS